MALVLGLGIGDVVDIAAQWVALLSVDGLHRATLISNNGCKIAISADEMTRIAPEVWVGLGPDVATSRLRLLVDAPRHIAIARRHN
jgi:hypothetical protein